MVQTHKLGMNNSIVDDLLMICKDICIKFFIQTLRKTAIERTVLIPVLLFEHEH